MVQAVMACMRSCQPSSGCRKNNIANLLSLAKFHSTSTNTCLTNYAQNQPSRLRQTFTSYRDICSLRFRFYSLGMQILLTATLVGQLAVVGSA